MKHVYGFLLLCGIFTLGVMSLHTQLGHMGYTVAAVAFSVAISAFFGYVLEGNREEPYIEKIGDCVLAVYFPSVEPPSSVEKYVGKVTTWEAVDRGPGGIWMMRPTDLLGHQSAVPLTELLIRERRIK